MSNIEWRAIKDYEDLYMVSNTGLIKSLHWGKEKLLKQVIRNNNYPYYFVGLLKNGKRKYFAVHRLVAMMFIPNPNNYEQVDHLDGNKLNNNVENLEWVTPKENTNRAWQKGLAHNTKYQREVARKTMLDRWQNNNHRLWRGTKTKQFSQMEYRMGE